MIAKQFNMVRILTLLEIAVVFSVFFLFGAWKVPDVNEAHYIGKAIHFWNPQWIPNDPFLQSKDAHWTFYLVFGWFSFFCSPAAMAWIGRLTAWSLLAWSWQRLSFALIPIRWAAVPTALALAYYIESFHMAGEWLIGGIEGKSLAYPFIFFALEAMIRRRWNYAGIFLGIAAALHILVGGWAALIAGIIFFHQNPLFRKTEKCPFPWGGVLIGGSLALCGLVPGLMLDAGTSSEIVRQAHQIYAFDRLPHHLVPYLFKDSFLLRFGLLSLIWILLCRHTDDKNQRLLNAFIWGTLALSAVGLFAAYSLASSRELSAEFLRFYWFRLADIALPMGVAIGSVRFCLVRWNTMQSLSIPDFPKVLTYLLFFAIPYFLVDYLYFGYCKFVPDTNVPWALTLLICWSLFCLCRKRLALSAHTLLLFYVIIAFCAPLSVLPNHVHLRTYSGQCRSDPLGPFGVRVIAEWQEICWWIKEFTPHSAKFWIPRDGHTFKWYAQRSDIGTWKNIPQDADSVVKWFQSMNELYCYTDEKGILMVDRLLTTLINSKTEEEIANLQQKYGFEYILCAQSDEEEDMPTHSTLKKVFANDVYCLYRVTPPARLTSTNEEQN